MSWRWLPWDKDSFLSKNGLLFKYDKIANQVGVGAVVIGAYTVLHKVTLVFFQG